MKINYGTSEQPLDISAVENHYGVKYIGDFCLRNRDGGWCNWSAAIFYQDNPNIDLGHTHYMAAYVDRGRVYVSKGDSAFAEPIVGVVADDGEIIYSRYRHDYRTSSDNSVYIDGGRDYVRTDGIGKTVQLVIDKDKLVVQN